VTRPGSKDEGQSTVELALALPLVAFVALAVVQVAVISYRQVIVVHAAREGARAAAVSDDEPASAAERAVEQSAGLDQARVSVDTSAAEGEVSVTVAFRDGTDVPLVGGVLPDVTLTSTATMRREQQES
jgi:hypothetical protein